MLAAGIVVGIAASNACAQRQSPPPPPAGQAIVPSSQGNPQTFTSKGGITVDELVQAALEVNPRIRADRNRWYAASHQIKQNYAPVDPTFVFNNFNSRRGFLNESGEHVLNVNESLQFPGKALLQAKNAKRTAQIARLVYAATARDIRAQAQTGFYQLLLDSALLDVAEEDIQNLDRVLHTTEIAYTANNASQADFITAEFNLQAAEQTKRMLEVSQRNDRVALNVLLNRSPDEPLAIDGTLELRQLRMSLDALVELGTRLRQEILEAALSEQRADTALTLAKLEYAPDYTLGYGFDHWLLASFAPLPTRTETHDFSIGFNIPIFFWLHQKEDVTRAGYDLAAAREDLTSIKVQTAGQVTTLYRQAQLSALTALLYRDRLIPLARQGFQVALIAYQSKKIDFLTLANSLTQYTQARIAYLQAANQVLAQRIALEQAIGQPLP
jgi:outer membrane protein TolC